MNYPDVSPSAGTILIIDDIPNNLRLLSDLLTKAGYTVRKVTNGEIGIESALLEPPDLILLDIKMPGIDGYEVCDRLKDSERTRQIPVIFLSALDDEAEKVMAFHAGGVDYIPKPFQVVEVLARIETHLKLSRLQQQLQQQNAQLQLEIEQRNSAETALAILNQGLEARIQQRTAELQAENKQLLRLQTELQTALAQEQLRSELKSRWITALTEKFRTPLTVIPSVIELLKQVPDCSDDWSRHLHSLTDHTQAMKQTLQDMLLLLDADAGQLAFTPLALDLTQFCQQLAEQWLLPSQPEYKLVFVQFGQPPETILIDPTLLRPICSHLLANAVRYSPTGGTILFELVYEANQVLIRIQDEGIGIPPDEQEKVFQRFYRARNSGMVAETAVGLGLAVVKQAVEQHGGRISVRSGIDRGSTFTVALPLSPPTQPD
ncbi:MAG: hybrid sensor histidine kinase/response regulator [Elainella sp. C42_A2020_010]|nr:hybrid sensor histidine kinase/response regulator [Elainella sp. C42_A2020_010]